MSTVIKVENLSKAYQLGDFGTGTISRDFERFLARILGKNDPFLKIGEINDPSKKSDNDVVWSLKDINFEIQQGEAVGIIGRNGAGKSTLLKVLSRITSPTTGSVKIKGRIASLLEVGTGFHPELTGRENIYLNGAILGMRKSEIRRTFDEIVDFSGVERYIDTPVKRYSSGMYVRLAFAVAAHLDSEILIIDEVLAVGDAEFQQKCLGKMRSVSHGEGRTVLFVSHNMGAVNQLCDSCILLQLGQNLSKGTTSSVIKKYLNTSSSSESHYDFLSGNYIRSGNRKAEFISIAIRKAAEDYNSRLFTIGDDIEIVFSIKFNSPNESKVRTSIALKTADGLQLAHMIDEDSKFNVTVTASGVGTYSVIIKDNRLYPGTYKLTAFCGDMSSTEPYDMIEDCISFEILDGGLLTTRTLPRHAGLLFLTPDWKLLRDAI